ncbi:N-6 DNA methylase [Pseudomonas aeruginosa]|uniref:N-6 DNA methylase n=1 Tax=Pseudomonas aeruginosa TaxID=287 RepID=UPI0009A33683|nr:N-6 DNA methylase [Pseudomonas aeruginosa]ASJ87485.1 Type I restriction-modification system methyltransferase subunit [Pseudomonas aeruginosa]MUI27774.1 N-6 DNA methylase [Pseudomonas aeruginosa]CAB5622036.1 Type I restriction-modification system methyltransferase subunit [Pseudomonas aeruginosa]CAC9233669.1 Type I restriction-modification system methyltransferase subunit [Pseudomonas aeruginosa]HBO7185666.1 N-6 DNA methylase [Pseudomonas aeruginosa]
MANQSMTTESDLIAAAIALGATDVPGISSAEIDLINDVQPLGKTYAQKLKKEIRAGGDPLGAAFSIIRNADQRRESGATYTPDGIVNAMMAWAVKQPLPDRIVDPGVGSARFLCAAGRRFAKAQLLGLEVDPLAALMARANLAAGGFADRSCIELVDYRSPRSEFKGRTLFIGNPPYVRHHLISPEWKRWLVESAARHNLKASQLAGLHVYFFLATVLHAAPGDSGAFITASEWLDVNYGQLVRDLFLGPLGGQRIIVVEPTATPFPDAATTAAITTFQIGEKPSSVKLRRVKKMADLTDLNGGRPVRRERLEAETRWSRLTHAGRGCPEGFIELGELCRVHRGTVTGANATFIATLDESDIPDRYKLKSITKARELIAAGRVLTDTSSLRCVVDLPDDLDELMAEERVGVERFLARARARGAHEGYVARNRRAWWSVGMRAPAPILATYMARRAPSFVRNAAEARHINIAHGLYPREFLTEAQMLRLVDYLSTGISVLDGRTYAGGLTKFEPGEMERLFIPSPALLAEVTA